MSFTSSKASLLAGVYLVNTIVPTVIITYQFAAANIGPSSHDKALAMSETLANGSTQFCRWSYEESIWHGPRGYVLSCRDIHGSWDHSETLDRIC